ncbi:MAG: ABC transporter permease subunit [Pedobacter sp.]|nr:ABC transporter permease subunit [Pedobacter sp.]
MSKPTLDSVLPPAEQLDKLARRRRFKDQLVNAAIGSGGLFVLLAITLIFFYLLYEVWPLLQPAKVEVTGQHATTVSAPYIDIDEYRETGLRVEPDGRVQYFRAGNQEPLGDAHLPLPAGVTVSGIARGSITSGLVAFGLSNGSILVAQPSYGVDLDADGKRHVTPTLSYPYGETPLLVDEAGQPLNVFAFRGNNDALSVMSASAGHLVLNKYARESSGAGGLFASVGEEKGNWLRQAQVELPLTLATPPRFMIMGQDGRWGYVFTGRNDVAIFALSGDAGPRLYQQTIVGDAEITSVQALLGNVSLLIGDAKGRVSQWFMVRDKESEIDKFSFTRIRSFTLGDAPVTAITPEARRKGFVAGDEKGRVGYFFTTSERTLGVVQAADSAIRSIAVSPRSNFVVAQAEKGLAAVELEAEHPDISWHSTWGKVWYESYSEPTYNWQSSSGNIDFESKLSLMPLTFGTIKAAFYAMLLGAPLAICAAMYTSMFMAPGLRRKAKPTIELMAALPTVILGFLAGLWLAPTIEAYLPGIFTLLILTPLGILLSGMLWVRLPREKRAFADGWIPLLLLLPVLFTGWLSFALSQPMELYFFGGDIRLWLRDEAGITFDQRNALIVGLAMGFAVIPNIYSIAEDALFAVPKHLTNGSLALGATPWQTLMRVVLPTASPGIFSALMIGLGRAVGETMIVLMATGNTAIMDWNIFEGLRTLSANVAVEMGEAEVASTHFRVLFLSALVLFVLTFILNTAAEVVRNRLRKKYGSL